MMPKMLEIDAKISASFAIVIIVAATMSIVSYRSILTIQEADAWDVHTTEVLDVAGRMIAGMVNQETGVRGYLVAGEERFLEPYHLGSQQFQSALDYLLPKTSDNPNATAQLIEIERAATSWTTEIAEPAIRLMRDPATIDAARQIEASGSGKALMDAFRVLHQDFVESETELLAQRRQAKVEASELAADVILAGGAIMLAIIVLNAFWFSTHIVGRVRERAKLEGEAELRATRAEAEAARADANLARRALEEAVEALDDGFVIWDPEDRLMTFNSAFRELMGRIGDSMAPGETYEDLVRRLAFSGIVPDVWGKEEQFIREMLALRQAETGVDKIFRSHQGRWIRQRDKRTPSGAIVGLRSDVTDMKQRELALEEAKQHANSANFAKSQFLANMSHEIRTPINGIIGMSELLDETRLDSEQRLYVRTIVDSSGALMTIIDDILDFSKIEAGKVDLAHEPFSLRDLLHDIAMLVRARAATSDVDICLDVPEDLPGWFVGDGGRLRQVLLNLASNAVKFTLQGYVSISVDYDRERQPYSLQIEIEDTGIGIPQDKQDTVFSAFEQVDNRASREFEGTGLGLAITAALVSLMGGRIDLASEPGVGSTFTVRFDFQSPSAQTPTEGQSRTLLSGKRIAVVDDLEINLRVLGRRLRHWGMQVEQFDSAESILQALRQGATFDLAIFDYHMPGTNGLDLYRACRADDTFGQFPVILYSSSHLDAEIAADPALSFADILLKPARSATLFASILDVLGIPAPAPAAPDTGQAATDDDLSPRLDGVRVLIAEDNRTNRLVLRKMLQTTGAKVSFADNGQVALEHFTAEGADIVLMDMSMPVMDGVTATRQMRALERRELRQPSRIIALTANAMASDRENCLEAGMSDFLSKPIRKRELIECIFRHTQTDVGATMRGHG